MNVAKELGGKKLLSFLSLFYAGSCQYVNPVHLSRFVYSNIRCFKIDQPSAGDASGAPAVWSHGYTEASGVKNK